jgi:hypothetical protein
MVAGSHVGKTGLVKGRNGAFLSVKLSTSTGDTVNVKRSHVELVTEGASSKRRREEEEEDDDDDDEDEDEEEEEEQRETRGRGAKGVRQKPRSGDAAEVEHPKGSGAWRHCAAVATSLCSLLTPEFPPVRDVPPRKDC